MLVSLTKACKLKNDKVRTYLPIRKGFLKILLKHIEDILLNQPYLCILYRAIFSTAYFGLFRIGELTQSEHAIRARDDHVGMNKNNMMFILRSSKTHGEGDKPQMVKITSKELDQKNQRVIDYCPFTILREYVAVRKSFISHSEQLFVFKDRTPVEPNQVRTILKKLLVIAGFDIVSIVYAVGAPQIC